MPKIQNDQIQVVTPFQGNNQPLQDIQAIELERLADANALTNLVNNSFAITSDGNVVFKTSPDNQSDQLTNGTVVTIISGNALLSAIPATGIGIANLKNPPTSSFKRYIKASAGYVPYIDGSNANQVGTYEFASALDTISKDTLTPVSNFNAIKFLSPGSSGSANRYAEFNTSELSSGILGLRTGLYVTSTVGSFVSNNPIQHIEFTGSAVSSVTQGTGADLYKVTVNLVAGGGGGGINNPLTSDLDVGGYKIVSSGVNHINLQTVNNVYLIGAGINLNSSNNDIALSASNAAVTIFAGGSSGIGISSANGITLSAISLVTIEAPTFINNYLKVNGLIQKGNTLNNPFIDITTNSRVSMGMFDNTNAAINSLVFDLTTLGSEGDTLRKNNLGLLEMGKLRPGNIDTTGCGHGQVLKYDGANNFKFINEGPFKVFNAGGAESVNANLFSLGSCIIYHNGDTTSAKIGVKVATNRWYYFNVDGYGPDITTNSYFSS